VPTPTQDPINPLSCRSITAAAAAPTLTRFDARLHPAFTCDSIPTCLESMLRTMVPSNTPIPACIQRILGLGALAPLGPLAPTPHTLHAIALAVLTPTRPSHYLPASTGDVRRYAHIHMLARSLPSTTSNGSWVGALAARSHTTHTTHHRFGCAHSHTATELPACIFWR
jgi:hypothetical protein